VSLSTIAKEGKLCSRCEKRPEEPLHACPYQQEINDSTDEKYCDCCQHCEQECRDDI
jgi:hypothetical protein